MSVKFRFGAYTIGGSTGLACQEYITVRDEAMYSSVPFCYPVFAIQLISYPKYVDLRLSSLCLLKRATNGRH